MIDRDSDWQEYNGATPNQALTTIVALGALWNPPQSAMLLLVREALITCRGSGAASAFLAGLRRARNVAGGALTRGGMPLLSPNAYDGPAARASAGRLVCATATNGGTPTIVSFDDLPEVLLDQQDVGGAYGESQCRFPLRGLVLSPGEGLLARASSGAAVSPSFRVAWLEIPQDGTDVRRAISRLRAKGML